MVRWATNFLIIILCVINVGLKVEASVLEEQPVTTVDDNTEENEDNLKKNGKKKGTVRMQKPVTAEDKSVVSVKGLSNLGNTCFFNAVIQVRLYFNTHYATRSSYQPIRLLETLSSSADNHDTCTAGKRA